MSTSRLPFNSPMNGAISFNRSDGDASRRPTKTKETGALDYMEPVFSGDKEHKRWRRIIGEDLRKLLRRRYSQVPGINSITTISDFPKDYVLYLKPRIVTEEHVDLYLYGSKNVYRSPREFSFHAYWLLTDPTLNYSNCECKYCSGTSQSDLNKQWLGLEPRQYQDGADHDGAGPSYTPPASPIRPLGEVTLSKLRTRHPYRVGELVWVHLRPPIRGDLDDQLIECWPAVVLIAPPLPRVWQVDGVVDRQPALRLRLLSTSDEAVVDAFDCLPYYAYNIPDALQRFMMAVRPQRLVDEASWARLSDIKLLVDVAFNKAPRQVTFAQALPTFVIASLMSWRLMDRWSLATIAEEGAWDTVWMGPECIQVGDLVRIRTNSIKTADFVTFLSPGAETRGIFLKISKILAREGAALSDVWLCGDIYEIVPQTDDVVDVDLGAEGKTEGDEGDKPSLVALESLPDPPLGFCFRSVLSRKSATFLPLSSVAGRYYPHIELAPPISATRTTSTIPPTQILSLSGFAPGDWPSRGPREYQDRHLMWETLESVAKDYLRPKWTMKAEPVKSEPKD